MGIAIFATQNQSLVQVNFLNLTSIQVPLGLVLVSSAGMGAIALSVWQSIPSSQPQPKAPKTAKSKFSKYEQYYDKYDEEDDFDDEPEDDWD